MRYLILPIIPIVLFFTGCAAFTAVSDRIQADGLEYTGEVLVEAAEEIRKEKGIKKKKKKCTLIKIKKERNLLFFSKTKKIYDPPGCDKWKRNK